MTRQTKCEEHVGAFRKGQIRTSSKPCSAIADTRRPIRRGTSWVGHREDPSERQRNLRCKWPHGIANSARSCLVCLVATPVDTPMTCWACRGGSEGSASNDRSCKKRSYRMVSSRKFAAGDIKRGLQPANPGRRPGAWPFGRRTQFFKCALNVR